MFEQDTFSALEVFTAYKKLKHYFYYDNTSLFIRNKISDFEKEIETKSGSYNEAFWGKMETIAHSLNTKGSKYWKNIFEANIDYRITPKSFLKKPSLLLTNRTEDEVLELSRINIFIDASIEIHIITVLWLMTVGKHLCKWVDKDNYAYQLEMMGEENDDKVVSGLRLYKPYFIQYQNWRDRAIEKAEQLLKEKKDVVILSLDIKDYFNSVKINLKSLEIELYKEKSFLQRDTKVRKLFNLLSDINKTYSNKIKLVKKLPDLSNDETILPIGLLSSGLLGNVYLRKFDKDVKQALNPAYYGRYVDDLLFVLTNVQVKHDALSPMNYFIDEYLINRDLLTIQNPDEVREYFLETVKVIVEGKEGIKYRYKEPNCEKCDEYEYSTKILESQKLKFFINAEPTLVVQSKKIILQDLDHKESPAIINNFKKNLEKNRSEFRFLPDEDEVEKDFDEEAFSLHYNDSLNKLRSIKEFSEDKYGASKYLAGKIFATSLSDEKPDKKTTTQILTFFKGEVGLSFHTLWEKVATYFIINEDADALVKFYRQCSKAISRISLTYFEDPQFSHAVGISLDADLSKYLQIAICTPLAFNPSFTAKNDFRNIVTSDFVDLAKAIRFANMFRHAWVGLPAINFTKYLAHNEGNNNLLKVSNEDVKANGYISSEKNKRSKFGGFVELSALELDERLMMLSPRYVNFHELNILEIYRVIHSIKEIKEQVIFDFDNIPNNAFGKYWRINNEWKYYGSDKSNFSETISTARNSYFETIPANFENRKEQDSPYDVLLGVKEAPDEKETNSFKNAAQGLLVKVNSFNNKTEIKKKIALANITVHEKNIRRSYLGYANTNRERRQELFKLINLVEDERCDLFVLPEVSVPYQWIGLLAYQSCRRDIGIIAGLEHWVNKHNFVFNFMVTILPIQKEKYKTCLIKIRLKNHYSHEEIKQLEGYRLFIPGKNFQKHLKHYDLFQWKKTYFSVFNCFELADINDRALFKSQVDFIVASEYNKDTSYFSEIAGSWVRDIHCFFIQVNSSDFGDSRVLQPSPTVSKNILQIKGGDNSTIIVGQIPIKELRSFQLKEYNLQKDDKTFRPTPPDFDKDNVLIRIKNLKFKEYGI